jgi:hypothetical protein
MIAASINNSVKGRSWVLIFNHNLMEKGANARSLGSSRRMLRTAGRMCRTRCHEVLEDSSPIGNRDCLPEGLISVEILSHKVDGKQVVDSC